MGQRFQIIVSIPKIYYNEDNPNNQDRQFLVYHNQWLYGGTALVWTKRLIESIKENLKETNPYTKTVDIKQINDGIKYANVISKTDYRNTRRYYSEIANFVKWDDVLDSLDNNNGYLFLYIDDKLNIKYCLINGYEDSDKRIIRTPLEYLKLFYPENDKILLESSLEWIEAIRYLNDIDTINYKKIIMPKKVIKIKGGEK